jgi:hypothetical protein
MLHGGKCDNEFVALAPLPPFQLHCCGQVRAVSLVCFHPHSLIMHAPRAELYLPVNKAQPVKHKRKWKHKNLHTVIRLLCQELSFFGYVGMETKVYL